STCIPSLLPFFTKGMGDHTLERGTRTSRKTQIAKCATGAFIVSWFMTRKRWADFSCQRKISGSITTLNMSRAAARWNSPLLWEPSQLHHGWLEHAFPLTYQRRTSSVPSVGRLWNSSSAKPWTLKCLRRQKSSSKVSCLHMREKRKVHSASTRDLWLPIGRLVRSTTSLRSLIATIRSSRSLVWEYP